MLISFVSFFFSWSNDQGYLADKSYSQYQHLNGDVENALGLLGAWLGWVFVQNGFGIAAFLVLPLITLLGLWLLFDYKPFVIIRVAIHTLLLMAWISLSTALIFKTMMPLLGGAFGYFGVETLISMIGTAGTVLFLIAYAVLYSFLFLNLNPFQPINLPKIPVISDLKDKMGGFITDVEKPKADKDEILINDDGDVDLDAILGKQEDDKQKTPSELPPIEKRTINPEPEKSEALELDATPSANPIEIVNTDDDDGEFEIEDNTKKEEDTLSQNESAKTEHFGVETEFDPKLELSNYIFTTLDLLTKYDHKKREIDVEEI